MSGVPSDSKLSFSETLLRSMLAGRGSDAWARSIGIFRKPGKEAWGRFGEGMPPRNARVEQLSQKESIDN